MVGFEDELMAINAHLCGESSKLQVIPIFGMGGIGRTTLAKNAYDDQLIVKHFQIRGWVTISQAHSAPQILSSLLVSVGAKHSKERDKSRMDEKVYKSLKGRRYLIVMDDMWDTKAWGDVRRIFPDDHNGSWIVLTTRLLDVATYPDSSSPLHAKHFMNLDQSWNLLQKKVFQRGNCPPELEDPGKTIATSCRGLTLAIVVIAGLLSTVAGLLSTVSQIPASWENIARNVSEAVTTNDEQLTEVVLSLSYNHMPPPLRPCYLHIGGFPEDHEIRISKLIKLWVAKGLLELSSGSKNCEDIAEEYLEDLVKRCLVLVTKRKSNGKIKSCNMHDLVRDLCTRKAQQKKFFIIIKDIMSAEESIRNQHRCVSIADSAFLSFLIDSYASRIHILIKYNRWDIRHGIFIGHDRFIGQKRFLWDWLRNVRLLRVLEVGKCFPILPHFSLLPPQVCKLFHLRYLALPLFRKIPAAISNLKNLQTLICPDTKLITPSSSERVIYLPFEIWGLLQPRHLISSYYFDGLPEPEATHLL